ncbi:hypothetical protein TRFO_07955 [Tritrichomonas foetus]|uniref:PAS domain-containing protein n=1 Tax=Tritrichomonas foetus TaxID=1144522 RepID=A0A1J4JSQ8_9EUKA|nr:hypothetical protein TRFO_07955 [Tritrichomonas foetus]|eukprot:OHT00301.1 hypothetical protein TRFO_07955 [Tritrichomonas foetus]
MLPQNLKARISIPIGPDFKNAPFYFPLITMMQRECQPSRMIRVITHQYPVFQLILLSMWPHFLHKTQKWEEILINIFFFATLGEDENSVFAFMIFICFFSFFTMFSLFLGVSIYYKRKLAIKPLLYIANVFIHLINPILVVPLGFQFGECIYRFSNTKNAAFLGIGIVTGILWLLSIFLMYVMYFYDSGSIYVSESNLMSYDGFYQPSIVVSSSMILAMSFLFPLINEHLKYAVVGLHIIHSIVFIVWLFKFPFGKPGVNYLIGGLICGSLVNDIVTFTPLINSWIKVPIFLVFTLISYWAFIIIFKKYYIKRVLTKEWNDMKDCLFILRVSMMLNHSLFTKGELIEHIAKNINEGNDRVHFSLFISYFPEYQPIFIAQMAMLKRTKNLTHNSQFILYQLRRLDIGRQHLARIDELPEICSYTNTICRNIKSLWYKLASAPNDVDLFKEIECIGRSMKRTEHKFQELISQYPNNYILAQEYARFLIECEGDIIQATEWVTKSLLLQEGKTFEIDDAIVHFLRFYHFYAPKIVPSFTISNLDDIDLQKKQENINNVMKLAEIRAEFQRSMEGNTVLPIYLFLFISIISCVIHIIYWLIYDSNMFNDFDHTFNTMRIMNLVTNLSNSVILTTIPAFLEILSLQSFNRMPSHDYYQSIIKSNFVHDKNSILNMSMPYLNSVAFGAETGIRQLIDFQNLIIDRLVTRTSLQDFLDGYFNLNLPQYIMLDNNNWTIIESKFHENYVSFFSEFRRIAVGKDKSWYSSLIFYNTITSGEAILKNAYKLYQSLVTHIQKVFSNSAKMVWSYTTISGTIYFITTVPLPIFFYALIRQYFSNIKKIILKTDEEVMMKGTDSISLLKPHDSCDDFHILAGYNFSLILFGVSIICSLLLLGGLIVTQIYYTNIQRLYHRMTIIYYATSIRQCLALELLYDMISEHVFKYLLTNIEVTRENRVEERIRFLQETNRHCNLFDYGNDKFSEEIQLIRSHSKCKTSDLKYKPTLHESLACLSMDSALSKYIEMATTLHKHIYDPGVFNSSLFINFMDLEISILFADQNRIPEIVMEKSFHIKKNFGRNISIIAVILSFVSLIILHMNCIIFYSLRKTMKTLFSFISRIPPQELSSNDELISVLLNTYNEKSEDKEQYQQILYESKLPVVFVDSEMKIQAVNSIFSTVFGYDANFINHQGIHVLISDNSVIGQLETMKYKTGNAKEIKNVVCIKENKSQCKFDLNILPIYKNSIDGNSNKKLSIIVITMIDQSIIHKLEIAYQNLKKYNDNIHRMIYHHPDTTFDGFNTSNSAICLIKIQDYKDEISSYKNVEIKQSLYQQLMEILKIYALLTFINAKNGTITIVASRSHNLTDLVIECLNFSFNILSNIHIESIMGNCTIVVNIGHDLHIEQTNNNNLPKILCHGNTISEAEKLLMMNHYGRICITEKAYQVVASHNLRFTKLSMFNQNFYLVEIPLSISLNSTSDNDAKYMKAALNFQTSIKEITDSNS